MHKGHLRPELHINAESDGGAISCEISGKTASAIQSYRDYTGGVFVRYGNYVWKSECAFNWGPKPG